MRLISQDGRIDIPYENFVVERENSIIKIDIGNCGVLVPVGIYSSEEKAVKVMEDLRNRYSKFIFFQATYQKGLLETMTKELVEKEALNIVTPIFRFPKDKDVEV